MCRDLRVHRRDGHRWESVFIAPLGRSPDPCPVVSWLPAGRARTGHSQVQADISDVPRPPGSTAGTSLTPPNLMSFPACCVCGPCGFHPPTWGAVPTPTPPRPRLTVLVGSTHIQALPFLGDLWRPGSPNAHRGNTGTGTTRTPQVRDRHRLTPHPHAELGVARGLRGLSRCHQATSRAPCHPQAPSRGSEPPGTAASRRRCQEPGASATLRFVTVPTTQHSGWSAGMLVLLTTAF